MPHSSTILLFYCCSIIVLFSIPHLQKLFEISVDQKGVPKIIQGDIIIFFEMKPKDTILLFDESTLAEQLTLIELDIFRRIQPFELMVPLNIPFFFFLFIFRGKLGVNRNIKLLRVMWLN